MVLGLLLASSLVAWICAALSVVNGSGMLHALGIYTSVGVLSCIALAIQSLAVDRSAGGDPQE